MHGTNLKIISVRLYYFWVEIRTQLLNSAKQVQLYVSTLLIELWAMVYGTWYEDFGLLKLDECLSSYRTASANKLDVFLTVHLLTVFVNNKLDAQFLFLYLFIPILYMFRATNCSSSWESIVSIRPLVYVSVVLLTVQHAGLDETSWASGCLLTFRRLMSTIVVVPHR